MVAAHYVLQHPQVRQRLEAELREAWPVLEEIPRYEVLEKLPYLVRFPLSLRNRVSCSPDFPNKIKIKNPPVNHTQAAVTKEGLRMFPGVIAHPRVVPREGAVISGQFIPGGVRFDFLSFTNIVLESPR